MDNNLILSLAADLLDGVAGSQDHHWRWPIGWSDEQRIEFLRAFYRYNSDTEGPDDREWDELQEEIALVRKAGHGMPTYCVMHVVADILRGMAGNTDPSVQNDDPQKGGG